MPIKKTAAAERWFTTTKPPSVAALRRVRDIVLGADPSMRERVQYGITFSSTKSGAFAAFVRYREPGVNLRLHRGGRLRGHYPHLEGSTVRRMRIADLAEANLRAAELRAMVKEWCGLALLRSSHRRPPPHTSPRNRSPRTDKLGAF